MSQHILRRLLVAVPSLLGMAATNHGARCSVY